jgi:hypothetical protein
MLHFHHKFEQNLKIIIGSEPERKIEQLISNQEQKSKFYMQKNSTILIITLKITLFILKSNQYSQPFDLIVIVYESDDNTSSQTCYCQILSLLSTSLLYFKVNSNITRQIIICKCGLILQDHSLNRR